MEIKSMRIFIDSTDLNNAHPLMIYRGYDRIIDFTESIVKSYNNDHTIVDFSILNMSKEIINFRRKEVPFPHKMVFDKNDKKNLDELILSFYFEVDDQYINEALLWKLRR